MQESVKRDYETRWQLVQKFASFTTKRLQAIREICEKTKDFKKKDVTKEHVNSYFEKTKTTAKEFAMFLSKGFNQD